MNAILIIVAIVVIGYVLWHAVVWFQTFGSKEQRRLYDVTH